MKKLFLGGITLTGSAIAGVSHKMRHLLLALCLLLALPAEAQTAVVAFGVDAGATTWTTITTSNTTVWAQATTPLNTTCAGQGGGRIVLLDSVGGAALSTTAAASWSTSAVSASISCHAIAYGGGRFCAVGQGTGTATLTDGSTSWVYNAAALTQNRSWDGVGYGNGLFVAVVGDSINRIVASSPDCVTWTEALTGSGAITRRTVVWNGAVFALAGDHQAMDWSTTGASWTYVDSGIVSNGYSGAAAGTLMLILDYAPNSSTHQPIMRSSTTGSVWVDSYAFADAAVTGWASIAYSSSLGLWVIAPDGSNNFQTSPNGGSGSWTRRAVPLSSRWLKVLALDVPPPPPVLIPGHHRTRRFIHH